MKLFFIVFVSFLCVNDRKALNEYLEVKKTIFPRFYFVSNSALLDVLSNGNNPPKVTLYMMDTSFMLPI
jgi:hypothetical protein